MAIDFGFIAGLSFGFEILFDDGDELIKNALTLDLGILRIAFVTLR